MKHTETPWETSVLSDGTSWTVCAAGGGDMIADLTDNPNGDADATFIALACSTHEPLKEALNKLTNAAASVNRMQHAGMPVPPEVWSTLYAATNKARAVLVEVA